MKKLILSLLVVSGVAISHADDSAKVAELEAKVAKLELQNQTLRRAVEAIAGKPIEQIVGIVSAPQVVAPTPSVAPTVKAGPTPQQAAAIQAVKAKIADAELRLNGSGDPFADKPGNPQTGSSLKMSRADRAKFEAEVKEELNRLRLQLAEMEAIVAAQ